MSLLTFIIILVVTGVALWLINKYVPMDKKINTILNWGVVVIILLWLIKETGVFNWLSGVDI